MWLGGLLVLCGGGLTAIAISAVDYRASRAVPEV
jgi:hypothetical protein